MARTALVTGGTSGIGREIARELAHRQWQVLATGRNPEDLPEAERVPGVTYLALDLSDPDSIAACARAAGEVDALVHNAGESQSGPFEELPLAALERLFRVNVHGAVLLSQHFLPAMRTRGAGRIVMVGSMLASFPLAFRGSYVAAKAALKGFAVTARAELAPFGVQVAVVEPGAIATGIGTRRTKYIAQDSPYRHSFDTMIEHLDRNERAGVPPERIAVLVADALEAKAMKEFYALGSGAPWVFLGLRLLPRPVIRRLTARRHGL